MNKHSSKGKLDSYNITSSQSDNSIQIKPGKPNKALCINTEPKVSHHKGQQKEETKEASEVEYKIYTRCVFCKLIHNKKELLVYEDEFCAAFHDKDKKTAKEHLLVCPKDHLQNSTTLKENDISLLEHIQRVGEDLVEKLYPGEKYRYSNFYL